MTPEQRLDVERLFDGELPEDVRRRVLAHLAGDPEARRHLDRLALLRDLARRHDPASNVPRRPAVPVRSRSRIPAWLTLAATAAAVALVCWPRGRAVDPPAVSGKTNPSPAVAARPSTTVDRPPLEVELYGWANTPTRAHREAAALVLGPASAARKRPPADEILAIELANASPKARGGVRRFAVSKGSRSPAPSRSLRGRSAQPEV